MSASVPRITLKTPERFSDPFGLDYGKYIRTQAEKVSIFDTIFSKARDPDHDNRLDPAYVEALTPLLVGSYMGEYSAHLYCVRAAEAAPFRAIRDCCFYQAADERRHSEMDLARLREWGVPQEKIDEIWNEMLSGVKAAFDYVLGLDDCFQIIFIANFVAEGSAGASIFPHWAELARINGDFVTYVINRTRFSDEVRHIGFSRALIKAIVEDDEANAEILHEWLRDYLPYLSGFAEVVALSNDAAPIPYKTSAEWGMDGLNELADSMAKAGLDPSILQAMAPPEGIVGAPA